MNKTLMVLLLFIYGSMGGKILMSELSNDGTSLGQVISEAQLFFESISPQDRDNFILFFLAKGLQIKSLVLLPPSPAMASEFDSLDAPENFSLDLLEWTQASFEMQDDDVVQLLSFGVVCLDNGKCIYPSDVGSNCCLF